MKNGLVVTDQGRRSKTDEMKEMESTSQPFQIEELKQKNLKVLDVPQEKKKINQWVAQLLQNDDRIFILLT